MGLCLALAPIRKVCQGLAQRAHACVGSGCGHRRCCTETISLPPSMKWIILYQFSYVYVYIHYNWYLTFTTL